MSWEDFERYRSGRQSKRRRLFPGTTAHPTQSKQKPEKTDVISSFDSDSDSECGLKPTADKRKRQSAVRRATGGDSFNRGQSNRANTKVKSLKTLNHVASPGNIDSFESDSSAHEFTPPRLIKNKENSKISKPVNLSSERVNVKTVKLGFEPKFDSSFSDFETRPAESIEPALPVEIEPLVSEVKTPTKRSAATWLKGIKSPEFKPVFEKEDKSAKKWLAKKHPVGSLAQRAQSMIRYNRGEYLMWLHKNIHSTRTPPFNSSCYFGNVVSTEAKVKFNLLTVQTVEVKQAGRNVTVLIPADKKFGEFKPGNVLVVFPEFLCFVRNSEYFLVTLFHAQFFEKTCFDFDGIPKTDHFVGITERDMSDTQLAFQLSSLESALPISIPPNITPDFPIELHVCVYHIKTSATHVQLLGCDDKNNLVLIEIPSYLAQQSWDQISLSLSTTCHFTSLLLRHVALACKCLSWFPQLGMFKVGCQKQVHCFEMLSGTVTLDGDVSYSEDELVLENRSDFIGKYLGFLPNINSRSVCYFVSLFGTTQWIEYSSSTPPQFIPGQCLKFSNLISCGPLTYKHDELSLVSLCFVDKTLDITYPNLYCYTTEEELKISDVKPPSLSPFNQYLPELSPCYLKLSITDVRYVDREYRVEGIRGIQGIQGLQGEYRVRGVTCGVSVSVTVSPGTVRMWLGTGNIVSRELVRLRGREVGVKGVVVGKCKVLEQELTFMNVSDNL